MRTFNFILFHRFTYFTIIYFFSVITIMSISNRTLQISFSNIPAKKKLSIIVINLFLGMLTLIVHAIMIFHYRYKLPIFIISLSTQTTPYLHLNIHLKIQSTPSFIIHIINIFSIVDK